MFKTISRSLKYVEITIIAISMLALASLNIANVIARTFFNNSISSTEELSQFLIIAITFVGLAYAAREGRHIRMTAIFDQLSYKWRKLMMIIITFLTATLLLALGYWSVLYVQIVYKLASVSPSLRIPIYIIYSFCPIGLFLSSAQYYLAFIQNLRKKEVYVSVSEIEHREQAL